MAENWHSDLKSAEFSENEITIEDQQGHSFGANVRIVGQKSIFIGRNGWFD